MHSSSPLEGIRVIDMTEALAGPTCAMLLGDLGADVIKVERPGRGDQARGWGPPFLSGQSAYFLSTNRNKRSIALDIDQEADLATLTSLIGTADVLLTNVPRMSSLERRGLDPQTLRERHPRLIFAAISGYGHTGPKAGRPGYDLIAQAESGLMHLTGEPGEGPMRFPSPLADLSAGLHTLIGILAALYRRDRLVSEAQDSTQHGCDGQDGARHGCDGQGDLVDVALVDAQKFWLANLAGTYFATGQPLPKLGVRHPTITPYQPVMASDKRLVIAVGTDALWRRFSTVIGLEDSIQQDPRYATNAARNQNRDELMSLIESRLSARPAAEWVELLLKEDVPAAEIQTPEEALDDPHFKARGMVVSLEHAELGTLRSLAMPALLSRSPATYRRTPPALDEHGDEIRRELSTMREANHR